MQFPLDQPLPAELIRRIVEFRVAENTGVRTPDRIAIESIVHPGKTKDVDAGMYRAMRDAMLQVLPAAAPGLTREEILEAVPAHLPDDLYPEGAKAGWWSKAVQLDLEAKGVIVRESGEAPAVAPRSGMRAARGALRLTSSAGTRADRRRGPRAVRRGRRTARRRT